jgi:hypothetical protein
MDLPAGITCDLNVPAPHFKAACYEVAREHGAFVVGFPESVGTLNYYRCILRWRDVEFAVICNHAYPYIAFSPTTDAEELVLEFFDQPELGKSFEGVGFKCCRAEALDAPLQSSDTRQLRPSELADVRYWRPDKVGHAIFNWYD